MNKEAKARSQQQWENQLAPQSFAWGGGAEPGQHVPCVAADAALMHALLRFRFCKAGESTTADSCGSAQLCAV